MPKGINGTYIINIATIFQSENFFLKGIQWQGILGLAYSTLAKVTGCLIHQFRYMKIKADIVNK